MRDPSHLGFARLAGYRLGGFAGAGVAARSSSCRRRASIAAIRPSSCRLGPASSASAASCRPGVAGCPKRQHPPLPGPPPARQLERRTCAWGLLPVVNHTRGTPIPCWRVSGGRAIIPGYSLPPATTNQFRRQLILGRGPVRRRHAAGLCRDAAIGFRPAMGGEVEDGGAAQLAHAEVAIGDDQLIPQLVAWAMISPCGLTMMEWPNSSCPSSSPALATPTAEAGVLVAAGLDGQVAVEDAQVVRARSRGCPCSATACCSRASPARPAAARVPARLPASAGRCRSSCRC